MPQCPRCRQSVLAQAIACPHCHTQLKAYGHPGITLHRATEEGYLCTTCVYHTDDTCTFPQRPYATECTLYSPPQDASSAPSPPRRNLKLWLHRHGGWLLLVGLMVLCVVMVLTGR